MAKNLKLNIKNTQIAKAINLDSLKEKLEKKKAEAAQPEKQKPEPKKKTPKVKEPDIAVKETKEEAPRIRARSKSVFAEDQQPSHADITSEVDEIKGETAEIQEEHPAPYLEEISDYPPIQTEIETPPPAEEQKIEKEEVPPKIAVEAEPEILTPPPTKPIPSSKPIEKLGPTGRHVKDLIPPRQPQRKPAEGAARPPKKDEPERGVKPKSEPAVKEKEAEAFTDESKKKATKFKEFRDLKPAKKQDAGRFNARQGLRNVDEDQQWRKKRPSKKPIFQREEDVTIRPASLKIRVPISIKDLASDMKLKASQLISKLFLQGLVVTLNDLLEDETTIQLLGQEFGCEITIDTSEEERIRITDKTIKEEIEQTPSNELKIRAPVVAFMGHVDHGKTSLIDYIRSSNRVSGEAGAITQHIGAFLCKTAVGDISILDTPGHEAFSAMRARGADVTDIVVLVVAGDEGIRQQTVEAVQHAQAAHVPIVVAINKSDKPNFNPDNVYRQLADINLLPEAWGGQTITINCSAVTGDGINNLLEMLALQAEVLELKANPDTRARGSVLESKMQKGLGTAATVLIQNGTLRKGDPLVFGRLWGRVKTMRDEFNQELEEAGPSTPVEITGLSGLPEAGQEFIVVKSEKEARDIASVRMEGYRLTSGQLKKKISMENLFQQATDSPKKVLNIVLRADVQGSLEALKIALEKIQSDKAELNIIFTGVGEISESDVQLAVASKAIIIGFHTQVESHADQLIKELGIQVRLHDIIYHAIDDVKMLMSGLLDKIAQENEKGKAEVRAVFKSSQVGLIAGCYVTEGSISRNNQIRVRRGDEILWKGPIASLKRVKDDVKEVQKGFECGILLNGFNAIKEGDILEAYEIIYISQTL